MMKVRKYPFLVANTDRSDKGRTHWGSILDINPTRDVLLYDSFWVEGLKDFIIEEDKKIVEKFIKGIEKIERKDKKLTLVKLRFSAKIFRELKDNEKLSLSETAQDLFHFIENFGRYQNQANINMWILKDSILKIDRHLWTFPNILLRKPFFPNRNSKIHSYKKLTKEATETLLNEIFPLD